EIGLTPRNVLGDRAAGNELCLRLHLAGNPELVEQTGDVDPARATGGRIEIGDGLGGEQRLLERRDRADVRLRRAVFDNHSDANPREIDPAAGNELAFAREAIDRRRRQHGKIERLAALDALAQRADGVVLNRYLVARRSLEV